MATAALRRRRSDVPEFVETSVDVERLASEIFSGYVGAQPVVIDGVPARATFFQLDYCPDLRVMTLAGRLAVAVNRRSLQESSRPDGIAPLRVSVREIMLAALLHDVGKHHEDCAPFLELLRTTDLRGGDGSARRAYLLDLIRDIHCRKGPCMIDRLRDAGRTELDNPFIATVARRHGEDYKTNRCANQGCWWSREINVVTIADDYDAMLSAGPERAYKPDSITADAAAAFIRRGVAAGRYEPRIADIFLMEVVPFFNP